MTAPPPLDIYCKKKDEAVLDLLDFWWRPSKVSINIIKWQTTPMEIRIPNTCFSFRLSSRTHPGSLLSPRALRTPTLTLISSHRCHRNNIYFRVTVAFTQLLHKICQALQSHKAPLMPHPSSLKARLNFHWIRCWCEALSLEMRTKDIISRTESTLNGVTHNQHTNATQSPASPSWQTKPNNLMRHFRSLIQRREPSATHTWATHNQHSLNYKMQPKIR